MAFSTDNVTVTMRGDEWFALLAVLTSAVHNGLHKRPDGIALSPKGVRKFDKGKAKLESQLLAAAAGTRKMRGATQAEAEAESIPDVKDRGEE